MQKVQTPSEPSAVTTGKTWRAASFLLVLWLYPSFIQAHGDLHEQIESVTAQIATDPDNAELYLRRGELHRAHREWVAAQADFERAAKRNPALSGVELSCGLLWMETGKLVQAEKAFAKFLAHHPAHTAALAAHGRVLVRLGRHLEGAGEFTRALAGKPLPEFYLERARALVNADEANIQAAVRSLDEGLSRLGPVVTLQLLAFELEVQSQDYGAALSRLDEIMLRSPRKESWLARRGDVLWQAGRDADARAAWESALTAVTHLPPHRRGTRAMTTLESHVRASLARIPQAR